ncbi:hypothetical protein DFJ73DRAFT_821908 [Zopfochytrium polystomum]|nr:hypothetical protein DFJ73DRAFT_821908 [Zopfochytrium polystomum]
MFPSLFPLGADGHSVGTSSSSSQTRQVPEGLAQAVTFATAPRPDSDRLVEALKNGLATMNWMIWGIVVFVIFSAIFAVLFSAVGLKGYMFHFTLFFNWCLGFFVGIAIFLAAIVRSAKQYGRLVSATTRGRVPSSGDGSRS